MKQAVDIYSPVTIFAKVTAKPLELDTI